MEGRFSFGQDQFNRLFPFFVHIDSDFRIQSCGESIEKMLALKPGDLFTNIFVLQRPAVQIEDVLRSSSKKQLAILQVISDPDLQFRGQFEKINESSYIFLGTPWFHRVESLLEKNLTINDFAVHDSMIDLLHVLKTQEIVHAEIKLLFDKVTEQKDALKRDAEKLAKKELELRGSEQRLTSLIQNLQTGVLLEDEHRRVVLTNKMFCDMFGINANPELLVGADCSRAAEQSQHLFQDPAGFVSRIDQILHERKVVTNEVLTLANGSVFERSYVPVYVDGVYRGHLWKYDDITARATFQRKLIAQEEKYRTIIENMNLGLMEVNLNDEIRYVNESFCKMSGYTADELANRKAFRLFALENGEQWVQDNVEVRRQGISDGYEIQISNKTGEKRWWHISGAPNYNDMGELVGSIGIHLDITAQKKLETELYAAKQKAEESSKAKELFLANMSHEIRTPLNAIIGMIRELKKFDGTPKQEEYLRHAGAASQHLLSIVNNILDISKIEAGEFRLDPRPFSLPDLLDETRSIVVKTAEAKKLKLTFTKEDGVAPVLIGDDVRLKQVLLNFLSNAIKFTHEGEVSLLCRHVSRRDDKQVLSFIIRDTGVGIDKAFIRNLFKKFSQEDTSIGRQFGGTGLGMAISHELVQLMGGRIDVVSEKGKGTEFEIQLTLPIGEHLEKKKAAQASDYERIKGLQVLLVEDQPLNRLVAKAAMAQLGLHITEAVNGEQALTIMGEKAFDLILMDLQMPVLDGFETTRIIREELKIKTPVIALTANAFRKEIDKCMAIGFNDYVTKPFEENVLVDTILRHTTDAGQSFSAPGINAAKVTDEVTQGPIDLTEILHLSRGDQAFTAKMIEFIILQISEVLPAMQEAISARDLESLRRIAHKVKPTVDMLKMKSIQQEVRSIENLEDDAPTERLQVLVNKLSIALGHARVLLREEHKKVA